MATDLTRRRMAAILLAPAPVLAQTAAPSADPLEAARKQVRGAIRELDEVALDITVQPAFVFKP